MGMWNPDSKHQSPHTTNQNPNLAPKIEQNSLKEKILSDDSIGVLTEEENDTFNCEIGQSYDMNDAGSRDRDKEFDREEDDEDKKGERHEEGDKEKGEILYRNEITKGNDTNDKNGNNNKNYDDKNNNNNNNDIFVVYNQIYNIIYKNM